MKKKFLFEFEFFNFWTNNFLLSFILSIHANNKVFTLFSSTDKICAFFLEWKNDPTFQYNTETMPKSGFQLVKHDEKVADLLDDNLVANSTNLKINKSFSTTNRLINHKTNFVKDWEVS